MTDTTTIDAIYQALNPLPARLCEKGKVTPEVTLLIEANASISILMRWRRPYAKHSCETDSTCCQGESFDEALQKANAFIESLPSAEQTKLHHFMGQLGKLIDAGRDDGISVDYLNPLVSSMKLLSENVLTFQPEPERLEF